MVAWLSAIALFAANDQPQMFFDHFVSMTRQLTRHNIDMGLVLHAAENFYLTQIGNKSISWNHTVRAHVPESFFHSSPGARITIMSGTNRATHFLDKIVRNQRDFAASKGCNYWFHFGNMAGQYLPYWNKIAMLRHRLRELQSPKEIQREEALVWIDDDMVFTNMKSTADGNTIQRVLDMHPQASVIVTRDAMSGATLNTGIIIVRNSAESLRVLDEVWRRATAMRIDGVSLAYDEQSKCLHEQQALQEMVFHATSVAAWGSLHWDSESKQKKKSSPQQHQHRTKGKNLAAAQKEEDTAIDDQELMQSDAVSVLWDNTESDSVAWGSKDAIIVIEQRDGASGLNLNTFLRWSHFDWDRHVQQRYESDPPSTRWKPGDFLGHCTGLSSVRRSMCIALLLKHVRSDDAPIDSSKNGRVAVYRS